MTSPAASPVTAGTILTLPELQHLRRVSGIRGAGLVLHAWAVIAGAMLACAVWPSAITLVLAVLVIGGRQLGLAVLVHEAAHWRLFPHPTVNTGVARWLCAYPMWGELLDYRRGHHRHHRHARQPDDPDLGLADRFPVTPAVFWRDAVRDLCGVTASARVLSWRPRRDGAGHLWSRLAGSLAANAALLGVLAALGAWHLYVLAWILPLITWYPLATRIRNVAEHALVSDDDDPLRNARTVAAGLLARIFIAPYWVNYHLEHHLMVFVPAWKLRQAHALLLAKGYGPRMELASGYLDIIRRATAAR